MSRVHDPLICGIDPHSDCDVCKPVTLRLRRLEALQERLTQAGISDTDLADLIWYRLEDYVEAIVQRIALEQVRLALQGIKLVSTVDARSVFDNRGKR